MKRANLVKLLLVITFAVSACTTPTSTPTSAPTEPPAPTATPAPVSPIPEGPVRISGEFNYTNDIITVYYVEQAVALVDMRAFVTRDLEWEIPVESQILGFLELDPEVQQGKYFIDLPIKPGGASNDVDNDGQAEAGVQVFAVSYWPNLLGSPYSEGDDRSRGWPTYLASVLADTENKDEIIGGKLVVWSPDAEQEFPTGFGSDGLLFTEDDPVGPIPAGYSIVDLDQDPFVVSREAEPELTLYEPKDAAIKDYSKMSYTEAFQALFESVSTNWAFNDIESKKVDWDALYKEIQPRIAEAESAKDALAYYQALHDFVLAIPDGHTGIGDSQNLGNQDFTQKTEGGYGFAIRELDDGRVIVVFVTPGGPAEAVGMMVGAEVTEFNGIPIAEAIAEVTPYSGPFSLESSRRYQQTRYLLRGAVDVEATITFANPGGSPKTATLISVAERDSFRVTSIFANAPTPTYPVEFQVLDSGIGYIRMNSNYDDLGLIVRLFEYALKQFTASGIPNLIIDMRYNSGGANLGLAGFFYDQEILLGQLEYFSETTGQFEPEGLPDKVLPNRVQYPFEKIAVLVGPACASACELEAYGFAQVPDAVVVGMYPSAGVEAEVARGQYQLPEGISVQIPTGRFVNPDGSLFLEGAGVVPTVKVPITEKTILSDEDVVLLAAMDAVLGVDPNDVKLESGLLLGSKATTNKAIRANTDSLEARAQENYTADALAQMDKTFSYTIALGSKRERLLWAWGWCATSTAILNDNYKHIQLEFSINGEAVDPALFFEYQQQGGGLFCKSYYIAAYNWPSGETILQTVVTFDATINDGQADYPAGKQTFMYSVTAP